MTTSPDSPPQGAVPGASPGTDHEAVRAPDGLVPTLTAMIRATFPHERVSDAAYERVARTVLESAASSHFSTMKVIHGAASLDDLADGRFADLTPEQAHAVLLGIQHTPFFGFVRQTAVVNLYEDEEVWEALGYEGPSFHKGGYVDRGFDDLDWLPDPRIEEFDGEPLEDVVSALPHTAAGAGAGAGTGAANTRPAAVPAGQNRSTSGPTSTGRTSS